MQTATQRGRGCVQHNEKGRGVDNNCAERGINWNFSGQKECMAIPDMWTTVEED